MVLVVAIVAICATATVIRSTFGFGESLVAVPLLVMVMPVQTAVPLAVLMSILVAAIVLIQDHEHVHFDSAKWLILFALLGIPVGLLVLLVAPSHIVKITLGAIIASYGAYSLVARQSFQLHHDSRAWLFACGFLSGVLGGAYGLNGPPLVIYGNLRRWDAQRFRATLQAYFLPASFLGATGFAVNGLMTTTVLKDFAICVPAIVPAVLLGRYLNRRLEGESFFKFMYAGLIVLGSLLLVFTLTGIETR
jgi:uncharacterized membrane protein YfcA